MKRTVLTFLILLTLLATPAVAFKLTVLHVNDTHSYLAGTNDAISVNGEENRATLGGWPQLAAQVRKVRRSVPNVALLHAGDVVQGGLYFMKFGGRPEMELLDRLGFDAMTLGNHEFDKGAELLSGMLEYTDVPVLGANVETPGVPCLAERIKPYVILGYGGERVGVIGLTTPDTAFISSPGPGVSFDDAAATARKYVAELTKQGVNKIILLTHVGYAEDQQLAAEVHGVDVIVGGHSHTLLGEHGQSYFGVVGLHASGPYPTVVKGADGNPVYVVTAWEWSRVLGRLDLTFDREGRVTSAVPRPLLLVDAGTLVRKKDGKWKALEQKENKAAIRWMDEHPPVASVGPDKAIAAYLAPFTAGLEALRREVIGKASAALTHTRVPGVSDSGISLPHGSLLAPLVARSMLARLARTGRPADMALINGGGVRESIPQGDISVGTIYSVLPFNNSLVVLSLKGKTICDALEYGVTRGGGAFPYVANARYTADMNRPEGNRITQLDIRQNGAWGALNPDRNYRVVTNAYLAGGGDGYTMFKGEAGHEDTGFVDAQAFMDYVKASSPLAPPKEMDVTYIPAR
ncbi:bifunctional metallophosphatase/5'-nucleotidase [Pseudodesulfovibrio sp.]|uniref:bifunctional metallophosphatase/5'-nucleotidase n=1 Tax=unclassified Pseudodesulfovibrio TaxID=2661612 RepID=UPI003AFF8396